MATNEMTFEEKLDAAFTYDCARCHVSSTRKAAITGRGIICADCEYQDWRATVRSLNAPQG